MLARLLARAVALLTLLLALGWLASLAGVLIWSRRDEAREADAIIVLGAAQYVGRPSPVLRARLDHAVALWKRGLAPRLVLTGGTGVGDTLSEADVSRRYAMKQGVPASAIMLENEGQTTSESLRAVATYLRAGDDTTVILVSDPFHMLRLSVLARQMGLVPYTSPTRTSPISANPGTELRYLVSESVKVPVAYLMERREQ
jgi:uncharacterized SAM-binding protein YcdF (DUF218 family)